MKICFLADGPSIHTRRFCTHFASRGHEVLLITFRETQIDGVAVYYIDAGKRNLSGGKWRVLLKTGAVKRILKQTRPDILHALYATSHGMVGALTGFHPYVVTALGSDVLIAPQRSVIYKMLVGHVLKRADWITVMAEHMRSVMISIFGKAEKISVVPFGVDPAVFNTEGPGSRVGFTVISTRNFEQIYNIPMFLKAMAIVKNRIPGLKIWLAGDGSRKQEVVSLTHQLGLDGCVLYGSVPQVRLAELLRSAHVFVSVSFSDGNNVSLNEAMACGALPVVTEIPANTQWVTEGKNGFLVQPNDVDKLAERIVFCHSNYSELARKWIPENRRIVEERANWHRNMQIVEDQYKKLVKK